VVGVVIYLDGCLTKFYLALGKRSKVKTIDLTRNEIDLTRNYIQAVPKELMNEILKHVHYRDIVRLGLTDKSMNEMTRVEFSNLLSETNPILHRLVSRLRAPFMTLVLNIRITTELVGGSGGKNAIMVPPLHKVRMLLPTSLP
jgi:hypothetical protein